MAAVTLKAVNRAIAKAGIPLELERGQGYHYFIYDAPALNRYETVSEYVCYTKDHSVERWVEIARSVLADIELYFTSRGV